MVEQMKRDNATLKGLLQKLVNAGLQNDPEELRRAVRSAAVSGCGSGVDRSPEHNYASEEGRCVRHVEGGQSRQPRPARSSPPRTAVADVQISVVKPVTGRMSPRFDYGLWLDPSRSIRIVDPPYDIVPYLGHGRHSFAGHLHWHCIGLCRQMCLDFLAKESLTLGQHPNLRRMLEHALPLHNVGFIGAMAKARLEFLNLGYVETRDSASQKDGGTKLLQSVRESYAAQGRDVPILLDCSRVEERLQGIFREVSSIPLLALPGVEKNWKAMKQLIHVLAMNFVCFGDGPRWPPHLVDQILHAWTQRLASYHAVH
jgi:hypothetical protein